AIDDTEAVKPLDGARDVSDAGGMTFEPRFAIVTASDSGIGKATALALAEAGMDVGVTWHSDEEGARDTAAKVEQRGRRAVGTQLDVSDHDHGAVAARGEPDVRDAARARSRAARRRRRLRPAHRSAARQLRL